jgi:uncharacterized membrane protein
MTSRSNEREERKAPPRRGSAHRQNRVLYDRPTRSRKAHGRRRFLRASFALVLIAGAHTPAHADFRVCNRTRILINLAVGRNAGDDFATEGWWTVTPGSCATPIHGPLRGRYIYLYATDIDGADVLKGTVSMCIDRGKFNAFGIENCWRRGLQTVAFAEIDTLDSPEWTTFLTDIGK